MANTEARLQATVFIRRDLYKQFKGLCDVNGISYSRGLERVIVDAVTQGRLPGIEPLPGMIPSNRGRPTGEIPTVSKANALHLPKSA